MSKPCLLLVDAMALTFRAFYALPVTMTSPDGLPNNAVFGFANILFKAIDDIQPTHLAVCFDLKGPTFRHELFKEYKGHRPPPPEELVVQFPRLRELVEKLGIPALDKVGYEADDLMGTLAQHSHDKHLDTRLLTGDQDCFQLVTEDISVMSPKRGTSDLKEYNPEAVVEKLGIRPDQVIDYKALRGDSSDNIPGIKGIGEKTAVKLLSEFDTLENIYNNIDAISSKSVKEKLQTSKEIAYLSRELATIKTDVPIELGFEELTHAPDWDRYITTFQEFGLNRLVSKYKALSSATLSEKKYADSSDESLAQSEENKPDGNYKALKTLKDVERIITSLKDGFAIDLETTSPNARAAQIVGIALSTTPKTAYYIPLNDYLASTQTQVSLFHDPSQDRAPFQTNPILDLLKPLLEDPTIPKYTHNGKYERIVLKNTGITLEGIAFDTMLAAYILYPGRRVGLKACANDHLNIQMTSYDSLTKQGKTKLRFQDVPIDQATQYAAADADLTLRLTELFRSQFQTTENKPLYELYTTIEFPLQDVLADMEFEGVCLNTTFLKDLQKEFEKRISALSDDITELAQKPFNLNSPKQLGEILFDHLELPVIKTTKTGRSTDSSVLEKLTEHHPIAQKLIDYRALEKLQNTYVKALPELINPHTQKIHTSFNQTGTITGRLSSNNPNLQNIPIRTEEGKLIREAFTPSQGNTLLSIDYSQIELRLMAHLCQDKNMVDAFNHGADIHKSTAAIIFDVPPEDVTSEMRYKAKAVNFGIIYGISPFGLAKNINIPRKEAKQIIDDYFHNFPGIQAFMEDTIEFAKTHKYVATEYGRIRPIPEIEDRIPHRRKMAERTAINTRVQGTAADIMKIAMIAINKRLKEENLKSTMIIQVHDELVFDVEKEERDSLIQLVTEEMIAAATLRVPLLVDVEEGPDWKNQTAVTAQT